MLQGDATIRPAGEADLAVVASHFRAMWLEIGWRSEDLRPDWPDVVAAFIERARAEADFGGFVAEVGGRVVGTAACQVFSGLYPEIRLGSSHRTGYVWGVYVRPEARRRGLATRLTRAALDYLAGLGCAQVKLHASAQGDPVYRAMGFGDTNERVLALGDTPPPERS